MIIMIDPLKDIDWNLVWESRESAQALWNMCRQERSRIDKTILETDITEESHVLDIGAGPGTLAIPFAQKVAHVTAVEPAEGMCSVMREKMWWEK